MKVAVTGSTGSFGALAIGHLLDSAMENLSIVALARDPGRAASFKAKGVEIRRADYDDSGALDAALAGVDRLLLVSGNEFGKRVVQHGNVVRSAVKAGVKLIVYTSITNAEKSENPLAREHKATEEIIRNSGLPYAILRNNWYTENYADAIKRAHGTGAIMSAAGNGRVASVTRNDLAEAAAKVLLGETGAETGRIFELSGEPWDYYRLAEAVSGVIGRKVEYRPLAADELKAAMLGSGMPGHLAGFLVSLDEAIAKSTLDFESGDLEAILGRKPVSLEEGLAALAE